MKRIFFVEDWCRNAYAPASASLNYHTLRLKADEPFSANVTFVSDGISDAHVVRVSVFLLDGTFVKRKEWKLANSLQQRINLGKIDIPALNRSEEILYLRLETIGQRNNVCNEYFFGIGESPVYELTKNQQTPNLTWMETSRTENSAIYEVQNYSDFCALHVHPVCGSDFDLLADRAYFTLLPGEKVQCRVQWSPAFSSGFLLREPPKMVQPEISFIGFDPHGEDDK